MRALFRSTAFFVIFTACLHAQNTYSLVDSSLLCGCCSGLRLGVDLLCWTPRTGPLSIVQRVEDELTDKRKNEGICPSHDYGYRLTAEKCQDDTFFALSYTHFNSGSSSKAASGTLIPLLMQQFDLIEPSLVDTAEGRFDLNLQLVEAVFGKDVILDPCFSLTFFSGFKALFLKESLSVEYTEDIDPFLIETRVDHKKRIKGAGATFGIQPVYSLGRCLDVFVLGSLDLYVADIENRRTEQSVLIFEQGDEEQVSSLDNQECQRGIGTLNVILGCTGYFVTPCAPCDASLTLAYEFHHFLNMPGFLTTNRSLQEATALNEPLSFDGLVLRFALTF